MSYLGDSFEPKLNQPPSWIERWLITIVLCLLALAALSWATLRGVDHTAMVRCDQLLEQSTEYPQFFVSYSEHLMCSEYGYTFTGTYDAPINAAGVPDGEYSFAYWYYLPEVGKWQLDAPVWYDRSTDNAYVTQ